MKIKCFGCGESGEYYPYVPSKVYCFSCYNKIVQERDQLKAKNERLLEALELLRNWTKAYPLDMFPEPDLKLARKLLEDGGVSYDALNVYSMRHVINGVGEIINGALKEERK